jgi:hypothetical protein
MVVKQDDDDKACMRICEYECNAVFNTLYKSIQIKHEHVCELVSYKHKHITSSLYSSIS